MLKSKQELESYLKRYAYKLMIDKEKFQAVCEYANETYNIPKAITSDYLSSRTSLADASDFVLFCLLDSIENVFDNKNRSKLSTFFVEKEIKTYKEAKYNVDKLKFPIKFKMIQVVEDQWIGSIDFKMLMKLREAQMINYNENAQRTMTKIIRGETEFYKITLNESSVGSIGLSYREDTYIPTPITLTIPEDSDADFYYNEETCELVIMSLDAFDITDGYHRYIAACRECDRDPNFNYKMELRISNWSESKARRFVHQEDQKNKMKKIDSKSYDTLNDVNVVVTKVNTNPDCNLRGLINNNEGIINYAQMADLVNDFYFTGKRYTAVQRKQVVLNATKELVENINLLTEYSDEYLIKPYSQKRLIIVMTCFDYFRSEDKSKMCRTIELVEEALKNGKYPKSFKRAIKLVLIKDVRNKIEEVKLYV